MTQAGTGRQGRSPAVRRRLAAWLMAGAMTLSAGAALSQDVNPFAARVTVNGSAITNYELDQRALFLRLLRLPGDPEKEALRVLIEDRLGAQAAKAAGLTVTDADLTAGMTEFAARANLSSDDFIKALGDEGVAPETFRDFVRAGLLWRAVVQQKFPGAMNISDAQVERTIAQTVEQPAIRVQISELFLPVQPGDDVAAILEEARAIKAEIENGGSFGAAARQYSAAPTGQNGGRLDWMDLSTLPPTVAEKLLRLAPGGVSDPFVLPNAVALFQLNNLSEGKGPAPVAVQVEYAEYLLAADQDAASIRARVDRCGDLNLVARGQGPDRLRITRALTSDLPQDVGIELAKLDPGEGVVLTRGNSRAFLMLCMRQGLATAPAAPEPGTPEAEAAAKAEANAARADALAGRPDDGLPEGLIAPLRDSVRAALGNQRLEMMAAGYMEELRSEAIIVEK